MKNPQQTADDLKKTISARSIALNQFNVDLEDKAKEMSDMKDSIKECEKDVVRAQKEVLAAQKVAEDAKKLAAQYVKETAGKEEAKRLKHEELKAIRTEVNSAIYKLAGLQERMDIDYQALQNRYNVFKRVVQKNMEKLREDIK